MMKKLLFIGLLILISLSVTAILDIGNIQSWDIKYESYDYRSPVYNEECTDGKMELNMTYHKPVCIGVIDHYEIKTAYSSKVIGITDGKDIITDAYKDDGVIAVWDVPIGDRNFKEFPLCRKNEKEKGVCHET